MIARGTLAAPRVTKYILGGHLFLPVPKSGAIPLDQQSAQQRRTECPRSLGRRIPRLPRDPQSRWFVENTPSVLSMNTYLPVALTLAGCSIGAGLVALPAAFDQARPPVAGALLGGTALLNIFSLWYVAAAAKLSGATNYGEMALCFGPNARLAMVSVNSTKTATSKAAPATPFHRRP